MFILIMQFFWVYIDDLMGKGLSIWVILELLLYVSASLIPLALPLSILLSSLMTFGNFSENSELTALKSSGFSLLRIMRPLTVIVLFIAIGTFVFSNYVIPVANLKWHSLIYDIQNTKLTSLIKSGVYSNEIDGHTIKLNKDKSGAFKDIVIHVHTDPKTLKTVKAKQAKIFRSKDGNFMFFDLMNGTIFEELELDIPTAVGNNFTRTNSVQKRPDRIITFAHANYRINVTGFTLKRTDQDVFKDKYEMLNVFQIQDATDSLRKRREDLWKKFSESILTSFPSLNKQTKNKENTPRIDPAMMGNPKLPLPYDKITLEEKKKLMQNVNSKLYQINENIRNQEVFMNTLTNENAQFWIEFHRKFALTYSILALFFVGAPLGAIVRKGGFGAPVVIAALLFMVYFIIYSIGDNLADTYVVSPWLGMWLPALFFTPVAIFVTVVANNDRAIHVNPLKLFARLKRK
jgi:lipopolysaccharide export system permease protein